MTDGQTDDSGIIIHIIPISHYGQLGVRTREKKNKKHRCHSVECEGGLHWMVIDSVGPEPLL